MSQIGRTLVFPKDMSKGKIILFLSARNIPIHEEPQVCGVESEQYEISQGSKQAMRLWNLGEVFGRDIARARPVNGSGMDPDPTRTKPD